jgi:hypothetical protein
MTQQQEAEILINVCNSIATRNEAYVRTKLPKNMHYHDGKTFIQVTNVRIYEYRRLIEAFDNHTTGDKYQYKLWYDELIMDIIAIINPANIAIIGKTYGPREVFRSLGDFVEYKNGRFK